LHNIFLNLMNPESVLAGNVSIIADFYCINYLHCGYLYIGSFSIMNGIKQDKI
jgi:hypothetical protein